MLAARLELIGYTRQDKSIILKPPVVPTSRCQNVLWTKLKKKESCMHYKDWNKMLER